ncbi:ammonium transporter [Brevundimonas sp.]|uniref:ammonium transporter n=1 Tax=Brevundimonas sp. TaxID=1871086 RepID=UPI002ABA727F|nr:ammonium transporter [Brevundimonas sp.]MDZ4364738.1 ammonium transporter [Brevundimonas sp.]
MTSIKSSLIWAGGIIALALASSFAQSQGYIDDDASARIVLGATGLMIAWFGNQMPKTFVPSAGARSVNRVAGWSLAISGLIYAVLWVFASFQVALIGGCGAIIAGILVTVGYCFSRRSRLTA